MQIQASGIQDQEVLEAMRTVPRHQFVPLDYLAEAYRNDPLPIGYGQTISQPYIVAYMTEQICPQSDFKVLEIGTGSGYQAAVLAEIVDSVYTIEIVEELGQAARQRLLDLNYNNVRVKIADTIAAEAAVAFSEHFEVELVYCFEKPGVLEDADDDASVMSSLTYETFKGLQESGAIHARMIPKLDNSFNAIKRGVSTVRITNIPGLQEGGTSLN
ncbi:protein-L-isoaspartate(D-aspartate) O-methyltransferase [Sunxiuqinia elliptica]|uniref:Protein-L-isoaspartate O-methyltransferase n=2 Tax=Sunxiuqinia elliptica TaxID=655355 RepID=A0A1I2I5I3_9BACT|nr:protein-L-isoaspartate(D-aspartate) O-methyltransferase [Sunxiuqinia elliptica]